MGCLPCNSIPTSEAKTVAVCPIYIYIYVYIYITHIHLGKLNNAHTAEVKFLILHSISMLYEQYSQTPQYTNQ